MRGGKTGGQRTSSFSTDGHDIVNVAWACTIDKKAAPSASVGRIWATVFPLREPPGPALAPQNPHSRSESQRQHRQPHYPASVENQGPSSDRPHDGSLDRQAIFSQ